MTKQFTPDFPRLPSERLKKLVKSFMEPSKKIKVTRTYSIDYEGSLVFSFREGKLKPIDVQDLSQFFTENYGEAFSAFLEMDRLLVDNRKLVLRKHLNVYNYNRKTKEWCLVKSESGGLGCWDKSNHQDDEGKVSASGWTEKQILKKGDKFTTPYTEGVQTYAGLTNDEGKVETDPVVIYTGNGGVKLCGREAFSAAIRAGKWIEVKLVKKEQADDRNT